MSAPNRNYLWANTIVDELARSGLRVVCIAPGSRSTPLTIAFAEHPEIEVYRHLDERSAAFFALGLARATEKPVALVCTSGSAVGNFFPAVIEAHESRLPLIVLTGDRPPELRFSGANQTIDQIKIYGDYALWSVDMTLPEAEPEPLIMRYLRTTAARAYATANGTPRGVVHLNIPFRKPLEPIPVPTDHTDLNLRVSRDADQLRRPFTSVLRGMVQPTDEQIETLVALIDRYERGVIVCGTNCPGRGFPEAVMALAERCQYPVFAEPSSGVRFGEGVSRLTFGGYETFLNVGELPMPEIVIRFGDVPTSKWLNEYLHRAQPNAFVQVSTDGVWSDDLHQTTHFVHCDTAALCNSLEGEVAPRDEGDWSRRFESVENATWSALNQVLDTADFDGAFVHDLVANLPDGAHLFAGNSLPIRHVDQFGHPRKTALHVYANRGASGIDGNVSTALGIAAANPDEPVVLLIGDITLYHDMNGLFALKDRAMNNITVIVMNNDGGGIFQRLPVNQFDPEFTDLFVMPHGLDYAKVAALYDLDYVRIEARESFRDLVSKVAAGQKARLIEIRTDIKSDEAARRQVIKQVRKRIEEAVVRTGL